MNQVQQKIVTMQHDLEVVTEQYLDANIALDKQKSAAVKASAAYAKVHKAVLAQQKKVSKQGASAYQSNQMAGLSTLMTSGSPQEVLDKLNTLDQISTNKNLVLVQYAKAQQQAKTAKGSADAASAAAAKTIKGIAAKKTKIEAGLVTLKVKLSALTAAQRAQVMAAAGGAAVSSASASSTSTSTSTSASSAPGSSAPASTPAPQTAPTVTGAPSAAAQAAVNAALSRLGSPYVWAAAGPSSFDCSGLTMWSYAQAGVGLPHSSSAQRGAGPSVAFGSLLPGDLVFMPGHVGMYIGNGQVVHAPTTGDVVKIIQFSSMGWDYANRPTG